MPLFLASEHWGLVSEEGSLVLMEAVVRNVLCLHAASLNPSYPSWKNLRRWVPSSTNNLVPSDPKIYPPNCKVLIGSHLWLPCVCVCLCLSVYPCARARQRPWPSTATVLMPVKPLSAYPTPALLGYLAPWVEEGDVECGSHLGCGSWLCPSCLSLVHVAEGSLYSLSASVHHHESHQPRQEGHRAGRRLKSESVCLCLSLS